MIEPGIADLDNAPGGRHLPGRSRRRCSCAALPPIRAIMHFDIFAHQPQDAPGRPKGGTGQGARAILHALPALLGI
jgi:leucyl aminopeptidase